MALTKVPFSMIKGACANILDYGADATGATSSVSAIRNALSSEVLFFPSGIYLLDDEIEIDTSIKIVCEPANEYGSGGTVFIVSHNDGNKSGFSVGVNNKIMRFELCGEPKFDAPDSSYSAFAGVRCEAATAFIDGLRGTVNINCLYINGSYIGYVKRLQGAGKTYLCKVTGDTSLSFHTCNIGGSTGGQASFQIELSAGYLRLYDIYLEAQTYRNMAITNCSRAAVHIDGIYAENSSHYDIFIQNSENIIIDNYRTNTATKAVIIENSTNVKIDGVHAVDRFGLNEIVDIDENSSNIYIGGVLYDPVSSDGSAIRVYNLVRGFFTGKPCASSIVNPDLSLSAGGTTSTVGGLSVSSSVPADTRMLFTGKSINVDYSNPIKIPIIKYGKYNSVVIQLIYQSTAPSNLDIEIGIWKAASTQILNEIKYFHSPSANFQMLTFITRLPATTDLDQYSSLELRVTSGNTAIVHYFNMCNYDGGQLPYGFIDESVLFKSDSVDLNVLGSRASLVPNIGNKGYRLKQYELVYETSTAGAGADATVGFGQANTSGTMATIGCNFTTSINKAKGALCTTLDDTGPYPFRDHITSASANGFIVEVLSAGGAGGTAKGYIRAVPSEINAI